MMTWRHADGALLPRLVLGSLILVLALGGILGWQLLEGAPQGHAATTPQPPSAVPATTAKAERTDVAVLLTGLGTVQAFQSVEIRAQVNGRLIALPAKEGQEVKKGDVVAEIDPKPYQAALDQATAQRDGDAAQLQSAQLDLQRYQALAKRSFAPAQQVDDQLATVSKLRAAVASDNAAIETAKINLSYTVIRSPIDGRVSLYQLDVGNLIEVGASSNIVSITQDRPIEVVLTLPEDALGGIRDAMTRGPVPVYVSTSDGTERLTEGKILTPNNTIDTTTGTISIKALFANQDGKLWPGQFVETQTQSQILKGVVTVPREAIQHGPSGLFAYVVKSDNTVAQVPIQVGYENDQSAVVLQGLSDGENIVVAGQSRLSPGVRVTTKSASETSPSPAQPVGNPDAPT
jgi:multidrug efflux system membrane fusion protein